MDEFQVAQQAVEDAIEALRDGVADIFEYSDELARYQERLKSAVQLLVGYASSVLTYKEIMKEVHKGIVEGFCDQDDLDRYAGSVLQSLCE